MAADSACEGVAVAGGAALAGVAAAAEWVAAGDGAAAGRTGSAGTARAGRAALAAACVADVRATGTLPDSSRRRRSSRASGEWSSSGPRHLDERQLELQPRVEPVADLALGLRPAARSGARPRGGVSCLACCSSRSSSCSSSSTVCPSVRSVAWSLGGVVEVLQQEELAQVAQQVADELRVVGALVGQALHELERLGRARAR